MIYELLKDRIMNGGSGSEAIIQSLSISANGVYTASSGVDGYSPITVNVPQKEPNIQNLAISANGTYTAPADVDGYNPITVAVPERVPVVESKEIIENGTYTPAEGVDGFNSVVVNVPQKEPNIQNLSITTNGTYTAPSGTDGYSPVVVDVQPDLENITITANGTYSHTGKDGYDQVVVNVPQEGLDVSNITITDTPTGLFSNNKWNTLMPYFRNIEFSILNNTDQWNFNGFFNFSSNYTDLSYITFKMNCNMYYFNGWRNMFQVNRELTALPNFDWSSTHVDTPHSALSVGYMFNGCRKLRTISDTFFSEIPLSDSFTRNIEGNQMFGECYSLRKLPDLSWFDGKNTNFYTSYSIYRGIFSSCNSLDEIVDLPVLKTSNPIDYGFENGFTGCFRIKEMTFKTGTDSAPRADSGWKDQTIDLSICVGYASTNSTILGYNSGITADKEVTDDVSYQALKNDPDWFTCNVAYSRYNHDSAVNTINSLPDCAAFGTNTIKFKGESGSATDGGAINTLTAEEIAVATAKGWTVTLV